MNELNQDKYSYACIIRFEGIKKAYTFGTNDDHYTFDDKVVVETARGLELGTVIAKLIPMSEVNLSSEIKPVIRKATDTDVQEYKKNLELSEEAKVTCEQAIEESGLDMRLIDAQYTLDRSKVIFSYVADERVDFRELLKHLASIFRCRIELRQIGPRDKAKFIGGIGTCGQETCCSRFLTDFDVISINMAKNQLLALNIQKLSGQCGKLMCCLKYEDCIYKEARANLPKMNEQVEYHGKKYRVAAMNILSETARIVNREESINLTFEELVSQTSFKAK
jgi:cell fate regulator YaaT (PSP1 superfamily)